MVSLFQQIWNKHRIFSVDLDLGVKRMTLLQCNGAAIAGITVDSSAFSVRSSLYCRGVLACARVLYPSSMHIIFFEFICMAGFNNLQNLNLEIQNHSWIFQYFTYMKILAKSLRLTSSKIKDLKHFSRFS